MFFVFMFLEFPSCLNGLLLRVAAILQNLNTAAWSSLYSHSPPQGSWHSCMLFVQNQLVWNPREPGWHFYSEFC